MESKNYPLVDFFLTVFLKQSKMAVDLLSKEDIEKILSQKQIAVWRYLNQVKEATAGETAKQTRVARPTVNQALAAVDFLLSNNPVIHVVFCSCYEVYPLPLKAVQPLEIHIGLIYRNYAVQTGKKRFFAGFTSCCLASVTTINDGFVP